MSIQVCNCAHHPTPGAAHNPGCPLAPKGEIWTPPEKLDPNVQRMAWLLFLEAWKANEKAMAEGNAEDDQVENAMMFNAHDTYVRCLDSAKIVRHLEQNP